MELEGEIKGGEGGERERMRFVSTHGLSVVGFCASCGRERQEGIEERGKNGGKEGGKKKKKEHLGEDGEGQGCAWGAGKKNLPFFLRRPPFTLPAIPL